MVESEYTTVWDMRFELNMNIQGWIIDTHAIAGEQSTLSGTIVLSNGAMDAFQASAAIVLSFLALSSF